MQARFKNRPQSPRLAVAAIARQMCESLETRTLFNSTYFNLAAGPLSQNWENPALITTNDDWSGVPSIVGYLGDQVTTSTGVDPQTLTADDLDPAVTPNDAPTSVDVVANVVTAPSANSSGGVFEFALGTPISTSGNNTVAFQGSGTADAPYLKFFLNTTGQTNVNVAYDLIDVDSADNAIQPVALQYRVGSSGTWINLPAGHVADATLGASTATPTGLTTPISVTLPTDANNAPQVELRVITSNAVGNDEFVAVDNIVITSTGATSQASFLPDSYSFNENAGTGSLTIKRTQTTGAATVNYTLNSGSATIPADATGPGGATSGTATFAAGSDTTTIPITIIDDSDVESTENFTVTLSSPTNVTIGDGTATVSILDNDTPIPGVINFSQSSFQANESAGTATLTLKRTVGTGGAVTADYTITSPAANGQSDPATSGTDFSGPLTGTVSFASGIDTATITIPLVNDSITETLERLTVQLTNPTGGASLGSGAFGTLYIFDDDFVQTTSGLLINEISIDTAGANTPFSFFEIKGTPGATLGGVYLLAIESDIGAAGSVDYDPIDLTGAVIGSNGILLVNAEDGLGFTAVDPASGVFHTRLLSTSAGGFQVGSNSFVLVSRPNTSAALPLQGTDLDAQDTAVDHSIDPKLGLEGIPSTFTIFDAIAVNDGGAGDVPYGPSAPPLTVGTGTAAADMVIRDGGNTNAFDINAFYGGTFFGANNSTVIGSPTFGNVPANATLTPGGVNPSAVVTDNTPPTVSSITFNRFGTRPTVTVAFSEDVRNTANPVTASDFVLTNTTTGAVIPSSSFNVTVGSDGKSATITFSNVPGAPSSPSAVLLPNGRYSFTVTAGSVADLAGNALAANSTATFAFVNADFTGSGGVPNNAVDFSDLLILAQNFGQSGRTFAQGDANYDGKVDFSDLLLLAQNFGYTLPAALSASPTSTGTAVTKKTPFGLSVID